MYIIYIYIYIYVCIFMSVYIGGMGLRNVDLCPPRTVFLGDMATLDPPHILEGSATRTLCIQGACSLKTLCNGNAPCVSVRGPNAIPYGIQYGPPYGISDSITYDIPCGHLLKPPPRSHCAAAATVCPWPAAMSSAEHHHFGTIIFLRFSCP